MKQIVAGIAFAAAASLACCASGSNAQYQRVTVFYEYKHVDQTDRAWHAFMEALDRCHFAGYQDAQPADKPRRSCESGTEASCALFRVTVDYDCIGLGYQTSS